MKRTNPGHILILACLSCFNSTQIKEKRKAVTESDEEYFMDAYSPDILHIGGFNYEQTRVPTILPIYDNCLVDRDQHTSYNQIGSVNEQYPLFDSCIGTSTVPNTSPNNDLDECNTLVSSQSATNSQDLSYQKVHPSQKKAKIQKPMKVLAKTTKEQAKSKRNQRTKYVKTSKIPAKSFYLELADIINGTFANNIVNVDSFEAFQSHYTNLTETAEASYDLNISKTSTFLASKINIFISFNALVVMKSSNPIRELAFNSYAKLCIKSLTANIYTIKKYLSMHINETLIFTNTNSLCNDKAGQKDIIESIHDIESTMNAIKMFSTGVSMEERRISEHINIYTDFLRKVFFRQNLEAHGILNPKIKKLLIHMPEIVFIVEDRIKLLQSKNNLTLECYACIHTEYIFIRDILYKYALSRAELGRNDRIKVCSESLDATTTTITSQKLPSKSNEIDANIMKKSEHILLLKKEIKKFRDHIACKYKDKHFNKAILFNKAMETAYYKTKGPMDANGQSFILFILSYTQQTRINIYKSLQQLGMSNLSNTSDFFSLSVLMQKSPEYRDNTILTLQFVIYYLSYDRQNSQGFTLFYPDSIALNFVKADRSKPNEVTTGKTGKFTRYFWETTLNLLLN